MKPKTALEFKIVELSKSLPAITRQQHGLAFGKCFGKYAVPSRLTMFCLECGHNWKLIETKELKNIHCPNCDKKLEVTDRYRNGLKETDYYQIITTAENFQIVRMVCITKAMKKNTNPTFFAHEVMQIFIDETGKPRCMSKNVMGLSQYFDQWIIGSELFLKHTDSNRFSLTPSFVLPTKRIIPILKRNGFKGSFHSIAPQILFTKIITDSMAETLLKSNQHDLLYYHIRNTELKTTGVYWNAIKICNRNGYQVMDAKLWIDYLDLLAYLGKTCEARNMFALKIWRWPTTGLWPKSKRKYGEVPSKKRKIK
jgi:DNA-directed RNA polymerase subunit RPC12/RpoP